jgi:hypothetical protein
MIIGLFVILTVKPPEDVNVVTTPPNKESGHQPMDINDKIVHIRSVLGGNNGQICWQIEQFL